MLRSDFKSVLNEGSTIDKNGQLELLRLPELVIQTIVFRMKLQPLITTLPLVNSQLATFRETALRSNRHLQLFIGNQEGILCDIIECPFRLPFTRYLIDSRTGQPLYPDTDFHRLNLDSLDTCTVDNLTRLMPSISHLTLRLNQVDILLIPDLIRLLISWSSSLKSFTFSCRFTDKEWHRRPRWEKEVDKEVFRYMLHRLIGTINRHLSSLEYLSLNIAEQLFERPFLENEVTPQLCFPLLGRLKEFYFTSGDLGRDFLFDTLRFDSNLESLQTIGHRMSNDWDVYLDAFPLTSSPLASRFVNLPYLSASRDLSRAVELANSLADPENNNGTAIRFGFINTFTILQRRMKNIEKTAIRPRMSKI